MAEAALQLGADFPIVADKVACPEEQIEEVDAAGGLFEHLVALDGAAQLGVEEGREVGVDEGGELVGRCGELSVGGEDLVERSIGMETVPPGAPFPTPTHPSRAGSL